MILKNPCDLNRHHMRRDRDEDPDDPRVTQANVLKRDDLTEHMKLVRKTGYTGDELSQNSANCNR